MNLQQYLLIKRAATGLAPTYQEPGVIATAQDMRNMINDASAANPAAAPKYRAFGDVLEARRTPIRTPKHVVDPITGVSQRLSPAEFKAMRKSLTDIANGPKITLSSTPTALFVPPAVSTHNMKDVVSGTGKVLRKIII